MEVPVRIKDEIVACQKEFRNAIAAHQELCFKIKREPKNSSLRSRLRLAEQNIRHVSKKQKPFIIQLRKELDNYQAKRRMENRTIDYEADNEFIAKQIEGHVLFQSEPSIFHKSKSIKYRRLKRKKPVPEASPPVNEVVETFTNLKEEPSSRCNSTDDLEPPKSQILLNRRSNLLSALNKVYKQNTVSPVPVTSSSFVSVLPVVSTPEPVRAPTPLDSTTAASITETSTTETSTMETSTIEATTTPASTPSSSLLLSSTTSNEITITEISPIRVKTRPLSPDSIPDLQPVDKDFFLRYLGLLNPEEFADVIATLSERRKRRRTVKQEFDFDNNDKPKRKKKQYLQQVTPPTTRAQASRASTESNKSSEQNQNDLLGIKIPQELSIERIRTKECIVCKSGDASECLSSCESCDNYFHVSCHDRSPRGLKEDLCPTCIRRSASPDMFTEKTLIKRHLAEENETLNNNVKLLEKKKIEMQETINEQDERKKQLALEQTNVLNSIKSLHNFLAMIQKVDYKETIEEPS